MKNKIIYIVLGLIILSLLFTPLITDNGIVQGIKNSTDMKAHIEAVQSDNPHYLYYGQAILRFIMKPFAHSEYLETLYIWFNFLVLALIVLVMTSIAYKVSGKYSSYIIVFMMLWCSTGILALFKYGVIFNIINMYLILPMIIYLIVNWFQSKKLWQIILAVALIIFCSIIHYTGLYIAYAVMLAMIGYLIYSFWKHKKGNILKIVVLSVIVVTVNIGLSMVFIHRAPELESTIFAEKPAIVSGVIENDSYNTEQVLTEKIYSKVTILAKYASLAVAAILLISTLLWSASGIGTGYLYIMGCFCVALLGGYCLEVIADYNRLALDAASMLSIFAALAIGAVMKVRNSWKFNSIVYILVAISAVPNIIKWIGA